MRATLKVEAFAVLMALLPALVLGCSEQRIELARLVERVEIVAAADMGRADENLRESAAAACALDHLIADVPAVHVDLVEAYTFLREQVLGVGAIGAVLDGIDVD